MKRAPEIDRRRICKACAKEFFIKPSKPGTYCSVACRVADNRSPAHNPRTCEACGKVFTPSRHSPKGKHCSKHCTWMATKGPEFNAKIARETVAARSAAQRGRGEGKTYRKLNGRHEHRVVAEAVIGRPLVKGEVVHHKDGNHLNNAPENLEVMTQREHMREHGLGVPGVAPTHKPWEARWGK